MDEPEGRKPAEPVDSRTERETRLAKALRENLKRRKALQRPSDGRPETGSRTD